MSCMGHGSYEQKVKGYNGRWCCNIVMQCKRLQSSGWDRRYDHVGRHKRCNNQKPMEVVALVFLYLVCFHNVDVVEPAQNEWWLPHLLIFGLCWQNHHPNILVHHTNFNSFKNNSRNTLFVPSGCFGEFSIFLWLYDWLGVP